jgi:hypothetical protein
MQINGLQHINIVICSSDGRFVTRRSSKISQFAQVHSVGHTSLQSGLVPHHYQSTVDANVLHGRTQHELPCGTQQR